MKWLWWLRRDKGAKEEASPARRVWLIVGLGNPGKEYERTRHNIGFRVVQELALRWQLRWKRERKFYGWVAQGKVGEQLVHLLLPSTYMNESGKAVKAYMDYYQLSLEDLLVISDDLELPLGQLRVRKEGGSGGHNGLKSIQQSLGTTCYQRLRFGIGRGEGVEAREWVLAPFSEEEEKQLGEMVQSCVQTVEELLVHPVDKVMHRRNVKRNV
jgi:PTH1 family peptidyl-tRNA hydrolase